MLLTCELSLWTIINHLLWISPSTEMLMPNPLRQGKELADDETPFNSGQFRYETVPLPAMQELMKSH